MDSTQKIKLSSLLSLAGIHFLADFLILLNRGAWWDGFRILTYAQENNLESVWLHLAQYQSYPLYYTIKIGMMFGDYFIIFMKSGVYLAWLTSTLLLYAILRKIMSLPEKDSFFISACFVLFPAYAFRGEIIYIIFSWTIALFFAGILTYFSATTYASKLSRYSRYAASAILFFGAFWNRAILVFYGGFLLLQLFKYYRAQYPDHQIPPPKFILQWFKSHIIFILLPISFWIFHSFLGESYNVGADYNKLLFLEPGFIRSLIDNAWSYVAYGFGWPLIAPLTILDRRLFVLLLIPISVVVWFITKNILKIPKPNVQNIVDATSKSPTPIYYISVGLLWFVLGAFPYLAIGQYLTIYGDGFHMRYAILVSLGASLIIIGLISTTIRRRWQPTVQALLISLFIVYNIFNHFKLDMDWYRQEAIVQSLKETQNTEIKNASTLLFYDELDELKYSGRTIKTGDHTVYLYRAFSPEQFKFALSMNVGDDQPYETLESAVMRHFERMKTYGAIAIPEKFDPLRSMVKVAVITKSGRELATIAQWLKLKKLELFADKETFYNALRDDLKIAVVPYTPSIITE